MKRNQFVKTHRQVDAVVNNVGTIQVGPIESTTVDNIREAMDTLFGGGICTNSYPICSNAVVVALSIPPLSVVKSPPWAIREAFYIDELRKGDKVEEFRFEI